jgi:hypothetical protein
MKKEIVIAAYDKELNWMSQFNSDVKQTIYRKGIKTDNPNEIFIEPNLGRCVHSFFNHIYMNYDKMSDYTFFAQDFPFDHWENLVEIINAPILEDDVYQKWLSTYSALTIGGYYGYHFNTIGSMWQMPPSQQFGSGRVLACLSNGHPQDHNPNINVDKYWDILFDCPKPSFYEFMPGGHFGITKEHVQLRSRSFYKKVVDLLVEDITAPWMIERLECYIFDIKFKTKL